MKPLVSVIIPVYNVHEYLEECVESVQNQSYADLEIILVDDGSTDNSGELCDVLAAKDTRVCVLHKSNGGLSDARNAGIMLAKGEYLTFLDGDDLLPHSAVEKLVSSCEKNHSELAIGQLFEFSGETPRDTEKSGTVEKVTMKEALRKMLLFQGIGHSACGKLYRRELWNKWKFPYGRLYEDYATIYCVTSQSKTVSIIEEPVYYYRMRDGSIMHSGIQRKNLELLEVSADVTAFIEREVPELREEAAYLQLVTYLKLLKGIMDGNFYNYPMAQERILAYVRDRQDLVRQPWAKRADKIKVKTLLLSKHLFYWVYDLGERKNKRN